MNRKQKIANLPQETKQYLINQYKEIEQCNSFELLEHSKKLKKLKEVTPFVKSLLFDGVEARQVFLNKNNEKTLQNKDDKMIKKFLNSHK